MGFVGPKVTAAHVRAAREAGACSVPPVGTPILSLDSYALAWCEDNLPTLAKRAARQIAKAVGGILRGVPPLSGSGSGSGSGDGSGYGYGYGDGYGYGSGDGYGDGYGYGYGYGDGSGYGYGDGSGSGDGYGYGSGDGYGDGDLVAAGGSVCNA